MRDEGRRRPERRRSTRCTPTSANRERRRHDSSTTPTARADSLDRPDVPLVGPRGEDERPSTSLPSLWNPDVWNGRRRRVDDLAGSSNLDLVSRSSLDRRPCEVAPAGRRVPVRPSVRSRRPPSRQGERPVSWPCVMTSATPTPAAATARTTAATTRERRRRDFRLSSAPGSAAPVGLASGAAPSVTACSRIRRSRSDASTSASSGLTGSWDMASGATVSSFERWR